jgi:hypothetical protein
MTRSPLTEGITAVAKERPISDEVFANELCGIAGTSDRVRLVALDRTSVLAAADENRLRREIARQTATSGPDSPEVKALGEKLRVQQAMRRQFAAEIQRAETVPPKRQSDRYILHGRVVDRNRLGQKGLTVSAVNRQHHPFTFTCTDERGYFKLEIPTTDQGDNGTTAPSVQPPQRELSLQVSDADQAILYRGEEVFTPTAGRVDYREIVLGDQREEPCPPPPASILMPDLKGRRESEAVAFLHELGLAVAERQTVPTDDDDQVGVVIGQTPKAGVAVTAATPITLVIGVAAQTVRVPAVVGLLLQEARSKIRDSGLVLGTITGDPSESSIVRAQAPEAGTEVPLRTAVNLAVRPQEQGVVDRIIERMTQDDAFNQIDVSPEDLRQRFASLGVETTEQCAALLTVENRQLRDELQLRSLRRAQTFKRILRNALETPK